MHTRARNASQKIWWGMYALQEGSMRRGARRFAKHDGGRGAPHPGPATQISSRKKPVFNSPTLVEIFEFFLTP
jgi:hypothetical protein